MCVCVCLSIHHLYVYQWIDVQSELVCWCETIFMFRSISSKFDSIWWIIFFIFWFQFHNQTQNRWFQCWLFPQFLSDVGLVIFNKELYLSLVCVCLSLFVLGYWIFGGQVDDATLWIYLISGFLMVVKCQYWGDFFVIKFSIYWCRFFG